ncbi:hypothetical protein SAMD00019534_056970 [Acytostelium subglobosum LB1]|uniref:hypothetical protein n=1 Tax=Acytostelium subglobosum LB1 TaxID=1410327 RepID=UPI000644C88A|nr:hypothetical protein SAMD00019534_056970 [Acytostelium subglobosum LB1]GAM22522.1 hypothetical protein SAMD00019534_056970 [Acytostelium subglobosum LB1]|eukprot:XP_012754642.1 hypothetical protein SAMD00019534_056970 [Acytostelium subglobosum LB1]
MSLESMLRYNATGMFIKTFDNIIMMSKVDNITTPIGCDLLLQSIDYNNATVFKHLLLQNSNGICLQVLDHEDVLESLCKSGNIDILESYLAATHYHPLPSKTIEYIPAAVDSGNEQFVRLLLKHIPFVPDSLLGPRYRAPERPPPSSEDDEGSALFKFKRRGITLGMLRLLHEEFDCLFARIIIWHMALMHSIKCNMVDSVRYIFEHLPDKALDDDQMYSHQQLSEHLIQSCLERCAKYGNITIFLMIIETPQGSKYLGTTDSIYEAIEIALDQGREDFLKHLVLHHMDTLDDSNQELLRNCFQDEALTRLRVIPRAAIMNNDIVALDSVAHQGDIFSLNAKMCRRMTESMARFICSPRTPPFLFSGESLLSMIKAVGKPNSNITSDIVHQFMVNCSISGEGIGIPELHDARCLRTALKRGCGQQTLELLFKRVDKEHLDDDFVSAAAMAFIMKQPLEDVIFVLEHLESFRNDPNICAWATSNPHLDVFDHVIGLFPKDKKMRDTEDEDEDEDDDDDDDEEGSDMSASEEEHEEDEEEEDELTVEDCIDRIIDDALLNDKPGVVDNILGMFPEYNIKVMLEQSLFQLHQLVKDNAFHSLEALFNSYSDDLSNTEMLRILYSILVCSYEHGIPRVITLCQDQIKMILSHSNDQMKLDNKRTVVKTKKRRPNAKKAKLGTVIHLVLSDKKLSTRIMESIGLIHRSSFGMKEDQLIKGAKLLDNHSLGDYIRYGATEWFIKSYNDNINILNQHVNTSLLETALASCNKQVVKLLLDNPLMTLYIKDSDPISVYFVSRISSCTHPDWEWVFDQYLRLTLLPDKPTLKINADVLVQVRHPAFVHKLVPLFNFERLHQDHLFLVEQFWFNKPCALEMLEVLTQHELITIELEISLFFKAIELDMIPIVRYFVKDREIAPNMPVVPFADLNPLNNLQRRAIDLCYKYGRMECLELLMDDGMLLPSFGMAVRYGNLAKAQQMHSLIVSSGNNVLIQKHRPIIHLAHALDFGHLDLANFILNLAASTKTNHGDDDVDDVYDRVEIRRIHHSILSIELLEKLLALPNVICSFDCVMGEAIKMSATESGDNDKQEVIKMLEQLSRKGVISTNFSFAFIQASKLADIGSIRRLNTLVKDMKLVGTVSSIYNLSLYEMINLIRQLNNNILTEETIKEFETDNIKTNSFNIIFNLMSDGDMPSLSTIKLFVTHLTTFGNDPDDDLAKFRRANVSAIIERVIKNEHIETIDYIINLALTINKYFKLQDSFNLEMCSLPVLKHLLDKGYISVDDHQSDAIIRLVDWACREGHLDIIQLIHQRCTSPAQLSRYIPTLEGIFEATERNHHQVIRYLLEGDGHSSSTTKSSAKRQRDDDVHITEQANQKSHKTNT